MEFCVECGEFVKTLDPYSGWCVPCTREFSQEESTAQVCIECNAEFHSSGRRRSLCQECTWEKWYRDNGDKIEEMRWLGYTLNEACQLIREANRPNCLVCGQPIFRGSNGRTFFCSRTQQCKSAGWRVKYLSQKTNLTKEEAIRKVLDELDGRSSKGRSPIEHPNTQEWLRYCKPR